MIRAVIFDLDDTLYNEINYVFGAFEKVSIYVSNKYKLNQYEVYKNIIDIFRENGRGKVFNILCRKYLINEDISKLVQVYRESNPKLHLYKDAQMILDWLKKSNFKLGIITDGCSKVQWNKINSLNLKNMFNKIIVTDDLGKEYWKPHRRPYVDMVKSLNVNFNESIYVGDNPHKDFITCKKLNMKTVRIVRQEGDHVKTFLTKEYEADININNLMKLKGIIQDINKGEANK